MARKAQPATAEVYRLKITLKDSAPAIWRRVEVKDCNLSTLHDIIQISMGWDDDHLHAFEIGGEEYGNPEQGLDDAEDERRIKLSALVRQGVKKFLYTYDFGDDWHHVIQIEKPVPIEEGASYPRCVAGARACPPEDCGGMWGYADLLEVVGDPDHPEREERLEWLGGEFDPEAFDLEEINQRLQSLRL